MHTKGNLMLLLSCSQMARNPLSLGEKCGSRSGEAPLGDLGSTLKIRTSKSENSLACSRYASPSPTLVRRSRKSGSPSAMSMGMAEKSIPCSSNTASAMKKACFLRKYSHQTVNTALPIATRAPRSEAIAPIHAASLNQVMDSTVHGDMCISDGGAL